MKILCIKFPDFSEWIELSHCGYNLLVASDEWMNAFLCKRQRNISALFCICTIITQFWSTRNGICAAWHEWCGLLFLKWKKKEIPKPNWNNRVSFVKFRLVELSQLEWNCAAKLNRKFYEAAYLRGGWKNQKTAENSCLSSLTTGQQ